MHIVWRSLSGSVIKHRRRLNIICELKHEALVGVLAQKFGSPAGKQFDKRAVMEDAPLRIRYRGKLKQS